MLVPGTDGLRATAKNEIEKFTFFIAAISHSRHWTFLRDIPAGVVVCHLLSDQASQGLAVFDTGLGDQLGTSGGSKEQ